MLKIFCAAFAFTVLLSLPFHTAHAEASVGVPLPKSGMSCTTQFVKQDDGRIVPMVNCQLGQTCPAGTSCCRVGGSVECCKSGEFCTTHGCDTVKE
jgi:hypothetical protein